MKEADAASWRADSSILWRLGPKPIPAICGYLVLLDDANPGLDVGEGMHGGQHRVPPVLVTQLSPGPPLQGEGGGIHEPPQIEILLKVGYPVFHLILIKVGLHESDLYVGLWGERQGKEEMSSYANRLLGCRTTSKCTKAENTRTSAISLPSFQPPGRKGTSTEECRCEVTSTATPPSRAK